MRKVAMFLIALGFTGLVLGVLIVIRVARDPGAAPFSLENYGGPGPIVGALLLVVVGLYLFSSARRED
jgi:hypothetical protein